MGREIRKERNGFFLTKPSPRKNRDRKKLAIWRWGDSTRFQQLLHRSIVPTSAAAPNRPCIWLPVSSEHHRRRHSWGCRPSARRCGWRRRRRRGRLAICSIVRHSAAPSSTNGATKENKKQMKTQTSTNGEKKLVESRKTQIKLWRQQIETQTVEGSSNQSP